MKKLLFSAILTALCLSAAAQQSRVITTGDNLSSSLINFLYQDSAGDIWAGTENGLNVFDGVKVRSFRKTEGNPRSLGHNVVRSMAEHEDGTLFVASQNGVQIYDRARGDFSPSLCYEDGTPFEQNINTLLLRRDGEIWCAGNRFLRIRKNAEGGFYLSDRGLPDGLDYTYELLEDRAGNIWTTKRNEEIIRIGASGSVSSYAGSGDFVSCLIEGPDGEIYAGSYYDGLFRYNSTADRFEHLDIPGLEGMVIQTMTNLGGNIIGIGTDNHGILEYNTATGRTGVFQTGYIPFEADKIKIHAIIKDRNDNTWVGAYQKGIIMIPASSNNFKYIGSNSATSNRIGSCCITSLYNDPDQTLWVGTDNDGLYRLPRQASGEQIVHYSPTPDGGTAGTVFAITRDSGGKIWFGSYNSGIRRLDPATGVILRGKDITGLDDSHQSVYAIAEDGQGRLWYGTMGNGLFCIDLKTGRRSDFGGVGDAMNQWITDIIINGDLLYAATYDGLYRINIGGEKPAVTGHLIRNQICYTIGEGNTKIYAGTAGGLIIMDKASGNQRTYTKADGLCDNTVYGVQSDGLGNLWVSTANGLSAFNVSAGTFINFYAADGLQSNEFSRRATARNASDGSLFFGGSGGVTYFNPADIRNPAKKWNVKITDFSLPEGSIFDAGTEEYKLKYHDNSCTVEFCTREYNAPAGITFEYSLNGSNWTRLAQGNHSVTLSNLKPGKYIFRVRALDNDTPSDALRTTITVAYAWWNCLLAKILYILLALGLVGIWILQRKRKRQNALEMEKHKQAEELNEAKLQFFMNLSHEIRTPMSLVDGPLQSLIESDSDPQRQQTYAMMQRSTRRILQLINQMLDIRKIDKGQLKLHFCPVQIYDTVADVCELFRDQARRKGLALDFRYSGPKDTELWVDPDQFEKIPINLLSNAVKYTPSGGHITVSLSQDSKNCILEVKDSGPGMPESDLERIFERFYQSGAQASGTGIGLNLTRMLVGLHHGSVRAANNADAPGSTFTVEIPLGNAHLSDEEIMSKAPAAPAPAPLIPDVVPEADATEHDKAIKRRTVLLVEDDLEIRAYVHQQLSRSFYIRECNNGKEALDLILKDRPDLVISDVMMPEMDGYTLCKKIRKNININTLPVILLTAKSDVQDQVEGLDRGADAYITKPFNVEVLRQTAMNLISSRERLKVAYAEKQTESAENMNDVKLKTPDEKLMDRIEKVVNANLRNPNLTVEMVAEQVGISRVHLHRKLKELTNQTSRDYIRNIRLHKAAELLAEKKHSIAELADAVGFGSPANFSSAFRELYGVSPTEYMKKD